MDDRTKTVAATGIVIGIFLLVVIIISILITGKKVLSPVPEEGAIKIIFLTPTPPTGGSADGIASPSATATVTPSPKSR